MSSLLSPSLDGIPQEVLEHIALLSVTDDFLGPPSSLVSLLETNRTINSRLSLKSNHYLYAKIFAHKFDLASASRRLGPDRTEPAVLAEELRRRCIYLKRLRSRVDSRIDPVTGGDDEARQELLFHAYLLMLENDGKNEKQLREYAHIDVWLEDYWFDEKGASLAKRSIALDQWPPQNEQTSLAMWLFWFLLKPGMDLFSMISVTFSTFSSQNSISRKIRCHGAWFTF